MEDESKRQLEVTGEELKEPKDQSSIQTTLASSLWKKTSDACDAIKITAQQYWKWANLDVRSNLAFYKQINQRIAESDLPATAKQEIRERLEQALSSIQQKGLQGINALTCWINALVTTDYIESLLKRFNEGTPSVYDKVLDASYNLTREGGGKLHRLFDENHTLVGAWSAIRNDPLTGDNPFFERVYEYVFALAKDFSSPVGLPFFTWNKDGYDQWAVFLSKNFNIPADWFSDLLHVNAAEAVGCSISLVATVLNWNKRQISDFGRLAASSGITSVAAGNPALCILAIVILTFPPSLHQSQRS